MGMLSLHVAAKVKVVPSQQSCPEMSSAIPRLLRQLCVQRQKMIALRLNADSN